ncbi:hypothetical protein DSM106972_088830 [Dulcicalothrix desertica PCC 7102]|uniref:HEAT repeat domain-containing protein n=1 Tax=Dulcicalothrix desertica PCC 7102 TaxID=232991 RepID=A0A433UPU8_9CYAN|nr:hypothetical protein [Dulcicalothrix desertica]RUS95870.1 hypothetical protein DSM106972_088830 [Dulcicalothrix desertica PCC 7102]TWH39506.1 hypothetical protein CAL7102_08747 [Dulcicalothrix desertica PCC 7102]
MVKDSEEPRQFDAVLGGQVPSPISGAVLGGIKGLRQRFASENEQVRLDAVANSPNYGSEGINILVKALQDKSLQVRVHAYKILKQLNQAESEIAKGIRLNVGDKIYCVYYSSLYYGDDWYKLKDFINERDKDEQRLFYQRQSGYRDGYEHSITILKNKKPSYWYYGLCELASIYIFKDKAEEAAKTLHIERLLDIDKEYGMIEDQALYHENELSQWCKDNGLSITINPDEDQYEFQDRIFKFLQQSIDIDRLEKFWEFTVNRRLAFVYERTIDRKCYLITTDNI